MLVPITVGFNQLSPPFVVMAYLQVEAISCMAVWYCDPASFIA